jgi:signal recognition particle subunit SRP68
MLIARSHTLLKDHVSALALYEKAQIYLNKIPESLGSFPEKDIPVSETDVRTQISLLRGELTRSHTHVILSQPSVAESTYFQTVPPPVPDSPFAYEEKPLASRLHQFPRPSAIDLTNLVKLPPKLEAVPVKPFFFDIAYSYVGLEEKNVRVPASKEAVVVGTGVPQKREDKTESAKRGWFWNR